MKTGGLLQSLEKFITLFRKGLVTFIFSAAEQISFYRQKNNKKKMVLQDGLSAVDAAKQF